jgi:hypothetical protein
MVSLPFDGEAKITIVIPRGRQDRPPPQATIPLKESRCRPRTGIDLKLTNASFGHQAKPLHHFQVAFT